MAGPARLFWEASLAQRETNFPDCHSKVPRCAARRFAVHASSARFAPPRNLDGTGQDRPNITGPMLAQYLLALMGPGRGGDPFSDMLGGMFGPAGMPPGGAESGRWGDYVFNQEGGQIPATKGVHTAGPGISDMSSQPSIRSSPRSWRIRTHTSQCQLRKTLWRSCPGRCSRKGVSGLPLGNTTFASSAISASAREGLCGLQGSVLPSERRPR